MAKNYIYCEETDTKLHANDIVTIFDYPNMNWIIKYGWYQFGSARKHGWYFVAIEDKTILPIDQIDLTTVEKNTNQITDIGTVLLDMGTEVKIDYLVIPGTNIRLYSGDIIKISSRPNTKWIVYIGWYIYQGAQNFDWYFTSLKDGEILPASVVDLTLCTLVTTKTQGSEQCDGKVVNYTRPFTESDAEVLNRTFITLETIEQRDNLDVSKLVNGRVVRVNDVGGVASYYYWDAEAIEWVKIEQSGGSGIPEVIGSSAHPVVLSELDEGLYRVKGTYKISPNYTLITLTSLDHIAFVNRGDVTQIKVITDDSITDYSVENGDVTFADAYATQKYVEDNYPSKQYVDDKIAALEVVISEITTNLPQIVKAIIEDIEEPIPNSFIQGLFA